MEKDREKTSFFYLKVKIKPQKRVKEETINVSQEYRATEGRRETPEGWKQTVWTKPRRCFFFFYWNIWPLLCIILFTRGGAKPGVLARLPAAAPCLYVCSEVCECKPALHRRRNCQLIPRGHREMNTSRELQCRRGRLLEKARHRGTQTHIHASSVCKQNTGVAAVSQSTEELHNNHTHAYTRARRSLLRALTHSRTHSHTKLPSKYHQK